jgi:hypothetical protein
MRIFKKRIVATDFNVSIDCPVEPCLIQVWMIRNDHKFQLHTAPQINWSSDRKLLVMIDSTLIGEQLEVVIVSDYEQ